MKQKIILLALCASFAVHSQSGSSFMKKGDYRAAAYAFENEVAQKPERYFDLAKAYFMMRDFDRASEALEQYKQKDPKAKTSDE